MKEANRALFAHAALALGRYSHELRREGVPTPPELLALAEFFTDCATVRQGATKIPSFVDPDHAEDMREHPVLTKRETAASLRVSVRTVERLIANGALASVRIEGSTKIRRRDLEDYIEGLSPGGFRTRLEEKGA